MCSLSGGRFELLLLVQDYRTDLCALLYCNRLSCTFTKTWNRQRRGNN